jgi:hypothetical protein
VSQAERQSGEDQEGGLKKNLQADEIGNSFQSAFPSMHDHADPPPPRSELFTIPRPVDKESFAPNFVLVEKTPEAAVHTEIAIIPHHKILSRRDNHRPKEIAGGDRPLLQVRIRMNGIRLIDGLIVDEDAFVPNLHLIVGESDCSLDEISRLVLGVLEDDDVPPPRRCKTIDELVHQDMIAYLKSRKHGPGWDLEGLDNESPDDQGQDKGDNDRFCIFPEDGFWFLGPFGHAHLTMI